MVGIIANPVSGRDIRRLVAYASAMETMERVRIIRRLLAGLAEAGVRQVLYMPSTRFVTLNLRGMTLCRRGRR